MLALPASHARLAAALLVMTAMPVRADGAMMLGDRELLREGPSARNYCDEGGSGSSAECERVKTKVLSGYSYGRGRAIGGLSFDPMSPAPGALVAIEQHAVSAALPGGTIVLGSVDLALRAADATRVRATLAHAEGMFFCRDADSGELALPFAGMLSSACQPNAMLGVDLGLFAMQWDLARPRMVSEWLRLGPSFELLGNGHGYEHLSRSIQIGSPFDLRTVDHGTTDAAQTSLGAGLRVAALLRTPAWEARLTARYRTALAGGSPSAHSIEGELLAAHNFFVSDAVVLQTGFAVRGSWNARPADAFVVWPSRAGQSDAFAGIHLGWSHESPDI